ncbi:hypothetical protein NQZ68_025756, partial [Dissostichus eleginoides]
AADAQITVLLSVLDGCCCCCTVSDTWGRRHSLNPICCVAEQEAGSIKSGCQDARGLTDR